MKKWDLDAFHFFLKNVIAGLGPDHPGVHVAQLILEEFEENVLPEQDKSISEDENEKA
jgi:hypothetical protein